MELSLKTINNAFALAKDKTGKWQVAQWVNDNLYTIDGKNRKICKGDEFTRRKYFINAMEYVSKVELTPGDRVQVQNPEDRIPEMYYVIGQITTKDGSFKYFIGI